MMSCSHVAKNNIVNPHGVRSFDIQGDGFSSQRQGAAIFELIAGKNQAPLVGWNALLGCRLPRHPK